MLRFFRLAVGGLLCFASVWLLAATSVQAGSAELTYPVLKTRMRSFTNATVTTRSKDYVFVLHAAGMTNVKIDELTPELQEEMGYAPSKAKSSSNVVLAKQVLPGIAGKMKPLEESWRNNVELAQQNLRANPNILYIALAVVAFGYLFFCYCCHLICIKANQPPSVLVWVPGLQSIPLFWAAGMSGWWFLVSFVPLVPILWAINIARARGKSGWVAFFLILPVTNLLAFLYLAFSSEAPQEKEEVRYKSMALQTA